MPLELRDSFDMQRTAGMEGAGLRLLNSKRGPTLSGLFERMPLRSGAVNLVLCV